MTKEEGEKERGWRKGGYVVQKWMNNYLKGLNEDGEKDV